MKYPRGKFYLSKSVARPAGIRMAVQFLAALATGVIVAGISFAAVVTTVGRGYCTEKTVPRIFSLKTECLRRSKPPRFVIMSGSNAQACLDCDALADRLQMDVVCAGLIFAVPVRFYASILNDFLQQGDVLYLPLETWHYWMTEKELTSPFTVSFTWGVCPRVQGTFPIDDLAGLYLKKGLSWIQRVVPKRLRREFHSPDSEAEYRYVERYPGMEESGYFKLRGDRCGNSETTMDQRLHVQRLPPDLTFSKEFRKSIGSLLEMAEKRGVRVLIGNTVWYSYPWERGLRTFEDNLSSIGREVVGNPLTLCLPYCCFTDYDLHCNAVGRRLLTREIADDLCRVLGKPVPERTGWPLVPFPPETGSPLRLAQAESCVNKPTFGEFVLDRKGGFETNVVERVLVNGNPVRFEERVYAVKNMLWVWWNSPEKTVTVEIVPSAGRACCAERVLMEPDPSGEIAKIASINDVSSDFADKGKGRFVCKEKNVREAYLRVRIPNWMSNRHRLHLTLRGGDFLRKVRVGGTASCRRDLRAEEIGKGEILVSIALNESDAFVEPDGDAVAGVYFPAEMLEGGEEITVERIGFELL